MRILKNIAREVMGKGKDFGGKTVPSVPSAHPLFRNALSFAKGPLPFMLREWEKLGDFYDVNFPQIPFLVLSHPDYVKHILVTNHRNYKKAFSYNFLSYTFGQGLVTNEGDSWLKQRRTAQPAFHRERLSSLVDVMIKDTESLAEAWKDKARLGQSVGLVGDMMKTTSAIVAHALFETDVRQISDDFVALMTIVNHQTTQKLVNPLRSPMWMPTPNNLQLNGAIRKLDKIIYDIIGQRRKTGAQQHDLLAMLMEAEDEESGDRMSDLQLRDETVTLMMAGTETSANALSWTFSLLLQHQEVMKKLRQEVDHVMSDGTLNSQSLSRLTYTTQVLNESMRIYPPAWIVAREALAYDEVDGFPIPQGSQVYMSSFIVHRHPDFWEKPHVFDPERFSEENSKGRHKFAFFPFGGGPRYCIGNNFAMMEMKVILASLVHHFDFEALSKLPVALEPLLTLKPRDEILLHVKKR